MNFNVKVTRKVMEGELMTITLESATTDNIISGALIVQLPIDTAGVFLGNEYTLSEVIADA